MYNNWILAEATTPETPAAPAAEAPAKEVPAQPLTESTSTSGTQAPGSPTPPPQNEKQQQGFNPLQLVLLVAIFVVMYFLFIRTPKKQQQQHQEMIRSLQKNDRVRTVGGIIGTVVDVKDDYVTLKVDETTNTKIRFVPNAISKNLAPETKD